MSAYEIGKWAVIVAIIVLVVIFLIVQIRRARR